MSTVEFQLALTIYNTLVANCYIFTLKHRSKIFLYFGLFRSSKLDVNICQSLEWGCYTKCFSENFYTIIMIIYFCMFICIGTHPNIHNQG